MKPGDNHELLDTILSDAESNAPSAGQVIADIRGEKRARANRRIIGGTVVSALLVALFVSRSGVQSPPTETQMIHATTNVAPPAPQESVQSTGPDQSSEPKWQIARVNDEQLLDLLTDTPVALTQDPDGNSRLMMVVANED